MVDLFARNAERHPDKPAFVDPDSSWGPVLTWSAADHGANQMAHLLAGRGVEAGSSVGWCGRNAAELLVLLGALRKLGAVSVPLGYYATADDVAHMVADSNISVVVAEAGLADLLGATTPTMAADQVLLYRGDGALEAELDDQPITAPPPPAESGGDIFYTSGTTGRPKGVVRAAAPDPAASRLAERIGFVTDDVYLTTGPLYHSGPARFATMAMALGNTIVVQAVFEPAAWLALVEEWAVTATFSAPTPIRRICSHLAERTERTERPDVGSVRRMVGNAAPWTQALKRDYLRHFPADSLWEVYGAAELGVALVLAPDEQLTRPGSSGRPAPGVDVLLVDEGGREVSEPGEPGELFVHSDTLFVGYRGRPAAYAAGRRGRHHSVGDVAYRDDDGYLYIVDRKKDMIISGGMNVYSTEVEEVLEQCPLVREAAVIGVPDDDLGERVHAVVVAASGSSPDLDRTGVDVETITRFARRHLAGYKVPRTISVVDDLPRTGSGKVLKRALREHHRPRSIPAGG